MLSLIRRKLIASRVILAINCSVRGLASPIKTGECRKRIAASHCKEGVPGRTRKATGLRGRASSTVAMMRGALRLCSEVVGPSLLVHEVCIATYRMHARRRTRGRRACRRVDLFSFTRRARRRGTRGRTLRGRGRVRGTVLSVGRHCKGGTVLGKAGFGRKTAVQRHGKRVKKRQT